MDHERWEKNGRPWTSESMEVGKNITNMYNTLGNDENWSLTHTLISWKLRMQDHSNKNCFIDHLKLQLY